MNYIIDKDEYGEIINIVEVHVQLNTEESSTYSVSEWKTIWGEEPYSGEIKRLYRNWHSLKSDRQWMEAVFEYWN